MANLVVGARVLNKDIADAGLVDHANLRRDQRVVRRHNDRGLGAGLDDARALGAGIRAARGEEVAVHLPAGGHVVARRAAKKIEDALQSQGIDHDWLARWMDASGYRTITACAA